MANSKLLKEAIADAKAVKETAIANAKIALEEAFTPKLQSILSKKLQSEMEMDDEEDMEEVAEEVDSSDIGKGGEPKYDEAHTELDPETEKETAAPGEELDAVEKVDDLKEEEDKEEVEEAYHEGDDEESMEEVSEEEVKEETEVNEEEDSEEVDEMAHDDEDEVDEELNLEDIIKELESELSEEEGEEEEEVEEGYSEEEEESMEEEEESEEETMEELESEEDEMDEDIDLDEILKEMGYGDVSEEESEEEEVEESNQVEELTKELEEAYATVKELKGTINEVNLLNAKLLYANKLFRSYAMNNDQKSKVVETLDRTKSVREVKLVFATLAESMKFGGETKRKVRVTEGIASKPQASTAPKKEIISESNEIANRFKKLANIK